MPISDKEINHIAKLARIGLSEKEKGKYSKELSDILDYMKKLNEINTGEIKPMIQAAGLENVFRKDENPHQPDPGKIKRIIGQGPQREGNFIKTKPILDK